MSGHTCSSCVQKQFVEDELARGQTTCPLRASVPGGVTSAAILPLLRPGDGAEASVRTAGVQQALHRRKSIVWAFSQAFAFFGGTMASFASFGYPRNFVALLGGDLDRLRRWQGLRPMRALRSTRTSRPVPGRTNTPFFSLYLADGRVRQWRRASLCETFFVMLGTSPPMFERFAIASFVPSLRLHAR